MRKNFGLVLMERVEVMVMGVVERFGIMTGEMEGKMGGWSVADRLRLREGRICDYGDLAEFHYLRNRPATATRVLVLEDRRVGVVDRYLGRKNEKKEGEGRVVGVLVESYPALGCMLRNEALGGRYAGWKNRGSCARLLNGEVRCISRVVVHPQWRGLGLAVRLVREALVSMTTEYTEALASMGRVHPFFRLGGMEEYRRWPGAKDQRLLDAVEYAGLKVWELAKVGYMEKWLKCEDDGGFLAGELRRWSGGGKSVGEQLKLARDRLLCEPVYYLKVRGGEVGGGVEVNYE